LRGGGAGAKCQRQAGGEQQAPAGRNGAPMLSEWRIGLFHLDSPVRSAIIYTSVNVNY